MDKYFSFAGTSKSASSTMHSEDEWEKNDSDEEESIENGAPSDDEPVSNAGDEVDETEGL